MKQQLFLIGLSACVLLTSCKEDRYIDLKTGKSIELEKDEKTGLMVNAETHKPVYIYVDTKTHDTIYGASGKVINGYIVKTNEGEYKYDDGGDENKIKDDDYKKKVDGDEIKIKDGDTKIKIEDGVKKVKNDN